MPDVKTAAVHTAAVSFLLLFSHFAAVFTKLQLSAGIDFQLLGGIKQADGNTSGLCLLTSTINMHGRGLAVDNKIADWQRLSS